MMLSLETSLRAVMYPSEDVKPRSLSRAARVHIKTHPIGPNLSFYFLISSSSINTTEIRTVQLLLRNEDDPVAAHEHFPSRGLAGVSGGSGAGQRSQSTAVDLGVTTSWFSPPFFNTQYWLSLKK